MSSILSSIEFDAPTQVEMCSSISEGLKSQISHLQKTYSKNEFITIITELAESDPLYFCDKQNLSMIYDKTIQHEGELNGTLLAQFAMALKEKNKEKFTRELSLYKEYISQCKLRKQSTIKSKDLLQHLHSNDEMGYLTECVYEMLNKQEQVSIKKLEELVQEIEFNFMQNSRVSIPKKLSLRKSEFDEDQGGFEDMLFEVVDRESIDIVGFRKLKEEIVGWLEDPMVSMNVERDLKRLEDVLLEINQRKIPSLKEEITSLTSTNQKLYEELASIYEEFDLKGNEIYQTKSKIIELTEDNQLLKKQLINTKIQLNENEEIMIKISQQNNQLSNEVSQLKESTKQFLKDYEDVQNEYVQFMNKLKLEEEEKKLRDTQSNYFPSLSLKQQLEDANFKIKRLKDQQGRLKNQLESNENAYMARIQFLEQELEEAKLYVNKAENLKASGMSRLSRNFEAMRNSNYSKKSMFNSVISVLANSKNSKPQNSKMSIFLDEVEDFMKNSKAERLTLSKKSSNAKQNQEQNHEINGMLQIDQQINDQYKRESKIHDDYNFCDVSLGQIRKKLQEESPSIMNETNTEDRPEISPEEQNKKSRENTFLAFVQVISKQGAKFKKYLMFNKKGLFMFDTKLRLEKEMKFTKISKLTFTEYNCDCFVVSFKRKESPMKKRVVNHESDIIFKCLRAKELVSFLSQPVFTEKVLRENRVSVVIEKQENIWIRESTQKDMVLSNCGNFYNPFRLNLSMKNHMNNFFYAELSRENFFSRSYIIICIVEEFGVYCFEWTEDELEKEKRFVYLLPLVKRMVFIREAGGVMVKVIYEDWSEGKTFLLRFKNNRESLKFETVCKERVKSNMKVIEGRKKLIESVFEFEMNGNVLDESVENSFQRQLAHEETVS